MQKQKLVNKIKDTLCDHGWRTQRYNGCFDLIAVRERTMFVKILKNIDSFLQAQAESLKMISYVMGAQALLIGTCARRKKLKEKILYERFDIPTVSFPGFREYIETGNLPQILCEKGGEYVFIDSAALKRARRKRGLTQAKLAQRIGVNKKTIYEHERNYMKMKLCIAKKLEYVLKCKLIVRPELKFKKPESSPKDRFESVVGRSLSQVGFEIDYVRSAPFDILAQADTVIVSDVENDRRKLYERGSKLSLFTSLMRSPALIVSDVKETEIEGVPVLHASELSSMRKIDIIKLATKAAKIKYFEN